MECFGSIGKDAKRNKKGHTTALLAKMQQAQATEQFVTNPFNCGCNQYYCPAKKSLKQKADSYNKMRAQTTGVYHKTNIPKEINTSGIESSESY